MSDSPVTVERLGIEHVPDAARHGSANRMFTLWFAANLTIADYAIGVLSTVLFGFTVAQAVPVLLVGNVLGGLLLGAAAAMGPSLGFPQMLSSRASFGRIGNYIPGSLTWVSTVGWFTVNTILGAEAIRVIFPLSSFALAAAILVFAQLVVAIYGHDFIHLFEKVMSLVLGGLFLMIFVLAVPRLGEVVAYLPPTGPVISLGMVGTLLVVSFSYLMSWAPYASDYSRYLSASTSKRRVAVLAMAGGAAASFAVEVIGAIVGSLTSSLNYFGALSSFAGSYGPVAILAVILGAVAANALNLYTNALSALVLDVKAQRWKMVLAGGVVGFAVALLVNTSFELFFENFLLALAYWITPWLGVVLVDFYVLKRTGVESSTNPRRVDYRALGVYILAIAVSVPFMVPPAPFVFPVGSLAGIFGGGDFSYFVSFGVAASLTYFVRMRMGRGPKR
ncbi:MAG: cytosine permease [Nitrososphaerales archaeon]|nr:cytosine permease [Nitrososphaerales archaeon]